MNDLFKQFKDVPNDQKKDTGMMLNELKQTIESRLDSLKESFAQIEEQLKPKEDLTKPAEEISLGSIHPLTTVRKEIIDIFSRLGFTVQEIVPR